MKNIKILLCIGMTLLLVTGCGYKAKLSNGKEVVAETSGKKITIEDLYEQVKVRYARNVLIDLIDTAILDKKYKVDDNMKQAVNSQIEYIKSQTGDQFLEAIKYYYGANSEEELEAILIREQQRTEAVNAYVKTLVTDKEINKYYDDKIVGDIKASHILIKPDVTDDMTDEDKTKKETEALNLAKDIIKKLNNGEKFADLAKKYSDDKSNADKGGDLGYFNKGTMDPAFETAVYNLKMNKYTTTPVKSTYGYHIILKTGLKDKPALKTVKSTIVDTLVSEKLTKDSTLQTKALIELRKDNKLKIYDSELKKQYDTYMDELLTPQTQTQQ